MLNKVAEPCEKYSAEDEKPAAGAEEPDEPDEPVTGEPRDASDGPLPSLPVAQDPPSADEPRDPDLAEKEVELSPVEKCEAREHGRRISKALHATADPTPQQVGAVLRRLGYYDDVLEGPKRAGNAVRFTVDLRFMGGQLCLSGDVSGTRTTFDPYGGNPEVACGDVRRGG
ncbi:hypothetical protein AB0J38_22790 [Streptomyces sp. NPDC050095]|uniref:hypothetical protein n=1 Tax=unclassified Streptomyces TaxID=2593676 RepID=UPI00341FB86B